MKSKTPFSIQLLKLNRKHHLAETKRHATICERAIKNKLSDDIRLKIFTSLRKSQNFLEDLNLAIKKLSPKKPKQNAKS